ncbi:MAG: hypothetical protein CMM48_02720 [Rhodospirillaceae bacterium]|nr:hypothetical protein [Rhodospirillaceae bacterium]HAA91265.1 hypothetical protein [Rhodospirillaceae bacterium]
MLFRKVRVNGRKFQDCWFINHSTFFKKDKKRYWKRAFGELRERGLTIPVETPYVGIRMANGERWTTVRFYWNAESDGMTPADYKGRSKSQWHAYNIEDHPEKLAYVEKLKKWGAVWRKKVKAGLAGKL